jgi:hypothetical protein
MSLKRVHIFFIAACLLLSCGFGAWAVRDYRSGGPDSSLYLGVGSFAGVVVLGIYGVWFLRKLRNFNLV